MGWACSRETPAQDLGCGVCAQSPPSAALTALPAFILLSTALQPPEHATLSPTFMPSLSHPVIPFPNSSSFLPGIQRPSLLAAH